WIVAESDSAAGPSVDSMTNIVSLATGALAANVVSTVILIGDALMSRR
ncbi:MAG: hypothetical protein ACJAZF_003686, partial [Granulosicoccus sp.]